ncbi:hypothetical protein KBY92_12620 [Synechococcus sp. Cruz CV-v-12]|nr:hypothetical protein [Synechococcus sp. Cruz CV-v-12]
MAEAAQGVAAAKARLLNWSEAHDAMARERRTRLGRIMVAGAAAGIGVALMAWLMRPKARSAQIAAGVDARPGAPEQSRRESAPRSLGRSLLNWAMLARVGKFGVSALIRALHAKGEGRVRDGWRN